MKVIHLKRHKNLILYIADNVTSLLECRPKLFVSFISNLIKKNPIMFYRFYNDTTSTTRATYEYIKALPASITYCSSGLFHLISQKMLTQAINVKVGERTGMRGVRRKEAFGLQRAVSLVHSSGPTVDAMHSSGSGIYQLCDVSTSDLLPPTIINRSQSVGHVGRLFADASQS